MEGEQLSSIYSFTEYQLLEEILKIKIKEKRRKYPLQYLRRNKFRTTMKNKDKQFKSHGWVGIC